MEREDSLPVTEAQWEEHSDAWRWAHLDRAPSAYHRRLATDARELHERLALGHTIAEVDQDHGGWAGLPHLALEMMAILLIVVAIVIATAFR